MIQRQSDAFDLLLDVRQLVEGLTAKQKAVVPCLLGETTQGELALRLGISQGAVSRRLAAVRRRLGRVLYE